MDRLDGPASLMVVSDLDSTMVDHQDPGHVSLLRFNALWEAYYCQNSLLVFSTGRSPTSYEQLRKESPLLTPDITILSVGTEIMYGESMIRDDDWEQYLNLKWNRQIVVEETSKFPELTPQSENDQRPHKVSFFVMKSEALRIIEALSRLLDECGLDVKIIYSSGTALDVLPRNAGKGEALKYLLKKLVLQKKKPDKTLVCGDSGNDAELFGVPDVYGVMVSNAQEELLQWYAENARNNKRVLHATKRCAAGIIQAIGNFSLGPNVSLKDIPDILNCSVETWSPSSDVVKFYLFYESWRRAEIDRSDKCMQYLVSLFLPLATIIHPFGAELSVDSCIDAMVVMYGDRQGMQYHVWVDRLSTSLIAPNTWLMKFYKWDSTGDQRLCCLTTVLMSETANSSSRFTWMHMHQTWLDGPNTTDIASWLF